MAETLVENQICNACGADVRESALFCYNCGGAVASQTVFEKDNQKEKADNVRMRETIIENGKNDGSNDGSQERKEELDKTLNIEKVSGKPILKPDVQEETKIKNAAASRRKSATFQKKTVEVSWEEHENAPNGWFIIATIILTLFALSIFFLAWYLK